MESHQVIYPVSRLLANPKLFFAIANEFDGPDWEILSSTFYDLIEFYLEEDDDPSFFDGEVCFREKPDCEGVYQVVLSDGNAIELQPSGDTYSGVETEDDLGVVSVIYGRLIKAIEIARPDLKDNIALCDVPTLANGFLRDDDGNSFRGKMHLLTDPDKKFGFVVNIINLEADELEAEVISL